MSWDMSETPDMIFAARKLVLSVTDSMDVLMDVIDPNQCERNGFDRYGNPLERDGESYTTLEFLDVWTGKLRRANSALREIEMRVKEVLDDGGSGPDSGA